ncbi:putative lipase atg15 [Coemansia sp. BCRC 34490]|nr:putative lipase atg15 [Coemansia sp. BCRC 34490]
MGRAEEGENGIGGRQSQHEQQAGGVWKALRLAVAGGLALTLIAGYFGGPIQMIPWRPDRSGGQPLTTPVLQLREVYVQSMPRPPSSLVALSSQGTQAGKAALRSWYDDQASMARTHGYSFPYRLSHWKADASELADGGSGQGGQSVLARVWTAAGVQVQRLWVALGGDSSSQLAGSSVDYADAYSRPDSQYTMSFARNDQPMEPMRISSADGGVRALEGAGEGPETVAARGTSRMLQRMRAQYLESEHGRRHSYWSASPVRGMDVEGPDPEPAPKDPVMGKWDYYIEDGLLVPNVTDKKTLVHLARMAANAYQPSDSDTWEQLGERWDTHKSFGWGSDGLRGHVFADKDNSTVVLSIKGTSSAFFLGGGSETSERDKYNDNRLFSCCCAYVDFTWSTVCGCHMSGSKCNATCLRNEINDEAADNYFFAAAQIFMDVSKRYSKSDIVLTGHSLGGSVVALLGLAFGVPVVAFETPGDKLASKRLHLPQAPAVAMDRIPLFHIGNTADPVFMGVCGGRTSSCYYAGYALESMCHNGRQLVFDTVAQRGWRLDIRHHRINEAIYLVFEPWGNFDPEERFPMLELDDENCTDCGLWKFIDEKSPQ